MKKIKQSYETHVYRKVWGPGDSYLSVDLMNVQVFEEDGFNENDEVKVTVFIEKMENKKK